MARAFILNPTTPPSDRWETFLRRLLWGVIAVLLLCTVGLMFFQFFISPNLLIQKIDIKSDLPFSREEIVALAGLNGNEYYFAIDDRTVEGRLETHPLVKEAVVEKIFPETLKLTLVGRRPLLLAFAEAGVGGGSLPVVFDDEGVLFERGGRPSERNLPVLSGVKLGAAALGTTLERNWHAFLKDLSELKRTQPQLYDLISELRVVSLASGGYELILYPVPYPVKIWIGKRINAGMLRYSFFTLHFMRQEGLLREIDEVDFRSGEAVYKRKGEQ